MILQVHQISPKGAEITTYFKTELPVLRGMIKKYFSKRWKTGNVLQPNVATNYKERGLVPKLFKEMESITKSSDNVYILNWKQIRTIWNEKRGTIFNSTTTSHQATLTFTVIEEDYCDNVKVREL